MSAIESWSTTAASNNASAPNGWPENMSSAGLNDSGREMMAALKTWYNDPEWLNRNYGATITRLSTTQFRVVGQDATAWFATNRRVKIVGSSTDHGFVESSSFSTDTTVTVTMDSGYLLEDGSEVAKATYPDLWAAFGSAHIYGTPSNPTLNFLLPNKGGKVFVGYVAGGDGDGDYGTVGATGGEKKHALADTELPAMASGGTHAHTVPFTGDAPVVTAAGGNAAATQNHTHAISGDGAHTHTYTGTGTSHENRPPFIVGAWIIKT
jgi:microcystin-dependent protein